MNFKQIIFLTLILVTLFSCKEENSNNSKNYHKAIKSSTPWEDLDAENLINTPIEIINNGNRQIVVSISYYNYISREEVDTTLNIEQNTKASFDKIELFRPEFINIKVNTQTRSFELIPNKKLELEFKNNAKPVGENANLYNALMKYNHYINQKDFNLNLAPNKIVEFTNTYNLPIWMSEYLNESAKYFFYYKLYQFIGKSVFDGDKSVEMDKNMEYQAHLLIQQWKTGFYHHYHSQLMQFKNTYESLKREDDLYARKAKLIREISLIPEENIKNSLLTLFTQGMIRKDKDFENKQLLINQSIMLLPENQAVKLSELQENLRKQMILNQDKKAIYNITVTNTDNNPVRIQKSNKKKLIKFWFEGCTACEKQIPFEKELLTKNPDIELITLCHSTEFDVWKENQYKNSRNYFLTEIQYKNAIKTFNLLYSPRYILLDENDELMCWNCPNPEDNQLTKLIKE